MIIETLVKRIQNIMRQDAGVDGDAQRISQLVWLLFLKVYDAKEELWEFYEDHYESIVPEECRWRNWAIDNKDGKAMTGEELLDFVNNALFPALKDLEVDQTTEKRKAIVKYVFADANNYMKNGTLLRQVINILNEVDFTEYEERHAFNDIYESILRDLQSAGSAGEFYTPRSVTEFMVEILNPQVGEKIADFACGTGGFLTSTLNYLEDQIKTPEDKELVQQHLFGIEKKPLPYLLAITNLILHDIDSPNIINSNSLARNVRDYKDDDKYDVILMNPPYGGTEEESIKINFPTALQSTETADLFMALIIYRLKQNGRVAVVLPNSFLFGDDKGKVAVRKKLLEECNLHTIVRLPEGVFSPYTSIGTNLLFFDKTGSTKETWYFEHPLPEGYARYSKTRPLKKEEFELEKTWWSNRVENEYAWKVSIDIIKENDYNLNFVNPNSVNNNKVTISTNELIQSMRQSQIKVLNMFDKLEDYYSMSHEELISNKKETLIQRAPQNMKLDILRENLFQDALQGRLSFQSEEDISSKELLERINTEKEKLNKTKKMKKAKPMEEISESELPYELPLGWTWVRIGEIAQINPRNTVDDDLEVGFVPMKSIEDGYSGKHTSETRRWKEVKKGFTHFQENDIAIAKITPCFENKKSAIMKDLSNGYGAGTTELHIVRPFHEYVLVDFLMCLFKSNTFIHKGVQTYTGTAGQQRIGKDFIENYVIALPPIEEQYRIVEKMKAVWETINEIEDSIILPK